MTSERLAQLRATLDASSSAVSELAGSISELARLRSEADEARPRLSELEAECDRLRKERDCADIARLKAEAERDEASAGRLEAKNGFERIIEFLRGDIARLRDTGATAPRPSLFIITSACARVAVFEVSAGGERLVTLRPDGTLEYGATYDPEEAARVFWQALASQSPLREIAEQNDALRDDIARLRAREGEPNRRYENEHIHYLAIKSGLAELQMYTEAFIALVDALPPSRAVKFVQDSEEAASIREVLGLATRRGFESECCEIDEKESEAGDA